MIIEGTLPLLAQPGKLTHMNHLFDDIALQDLRQRRSGKWSTFGPDVLPAWVAEMDFPIAPAISAMLEQMVDGADLGYPTLTQAPLDVVRNVFVERMARLYNHSIQPERVEPLTDVCQGIMNAIWTLSEPGDGVIIQTPIYPPFFEAVEDSHRTLIANPLRATGPGREWGTRFEMDLQQLEHSIVEHAQRGTRARILLFCSPHNPSGRVWTRRELEQLSELVLRHDLFVVADEIHAELIYPGHKHTPIASISPEMAARTVTLTSATKAFSVPGLRFALAAFGSEETQTRFQEVPKMLRGGTSMLGMYATLAAWQHSQGWLDDVVKYLDGNRRLVADFARTYLPEGEHPEVEATYLAWLDCRTLATESQRPYEFFLEHAKVALADGRLFGDDTGVRLNFATSRMLLKQILDRLAHAIKPSAGPAKAASRRRVPHPAQLNRAQRAPAP
jgi:cystathionine beta-lyase